LSAARAARAAMAAMALLTATNLVLEFSGIGGYRKGRIVWENTFWIGMRCSLDGVHDEFGSI